MDGLFVLALSPEDFSPETLALTSTKFSAAELSDREDLRRQGDSELITQLLTVLKNPATPLASTLVNISELSLLGQWAEVYHKAINHRFSYRRKIKLLLLQALPKQEKKHNILFATIAYPAINQQCNY